jgi:hypothetical protein
MLKKLDRPGRAWRGPRGPSACPRSALDEFVAAGETAAVQPREGERSGEPNVTEDDWARVGAALAESSAALASEDRTALAKALGSLADAAGRLADGLDGET